jgi:putative AdoMet-dependent methyltransferase
MTAGPRWQYDERKFSGVDYSRSDEVAACDAMHRKFRARDEFSTYDWIMEGLIARSGFHIDDAEYGKGFQTAYVCTKS